MGFILLLVMGRVDAEKHGLDATHPGPTKHGTVQSDLVVAGGRRNA